MYVSNIRMPSLRTELQGGNLQIGRAMGVSVWNQSYDVDGNKKSGEKTTWDDAKTL